MWHTEYTVTFYFNLAKHSSAKVYHIAVLVMIFLQDDVEGCPRIQLDQKVLLSTYVIDVVLGLPHFPHG